MQERRTRPATPADFHRLVDLAHERGLQLFREGTRWFCSSASVRGGCHYVTGLSCDCAGFLAHQRCTHHALLLERLGWLPDVEDERSMHTENRILVDCPACCGCGIQTFHTFEQPSRCASGTDGGRGLIATVTRRGRNQ
jgi:hypothetical protein